MALQRCRGVILVIMMQVLISGCTRYRARPLEPKLALQQIQRVTLDDVLKQPEDAPLRAASFNPGDGMDEDEVAVAALFLNPQLKAKRQAHGLAAAQLIAAGLWPNPDFDSKFQRDPQGPSRALEANLAIEVLRWNERKGEKQAAHANIQAVQAEIMAAEWKVAVEARTAYWDIIGLEAKLRANQAAVAIAEELAKNVRARLERGAGNQFDLNMAELDRLRYQSDFLRTEAEVDVARRRMLEILGLPPGTKLHLQVDRNHPTPLVRDWNQEALIETLPETPRLLAGKWRYEVAEGELRAAIARQFPSLRLGPATDFTYDGNSWDALLGTLVQFQVPFLNRNGAQIREKMAARDVARDNYMAELHALRAELADAIGAIRSLEKRVLFSRDEVLPKANESLALTGKAFTAGEVNVVSLLNAQTSIVETKLAYYDVLLEHRRALQRIESVLGRRLEDVVLQPRPAPSQAEPHQAAQEK